MTTIPKNTVIDECASTNDLARELARAGEPHGTWISARRQLAGRGRQGREWISEDGNLFLSIVLRPTAPEKLWSWVPIAVGLAACRALESAGVDARLKWPNDLYVDSRKLGGILCEGGGFVVAGIGINVASSPDGVELRAPAISLANTPSRANLADLRTELINEITQVTRALDPATIKVEFLKRSYFRPGDVVEWETESGKFVGLGEFGEIRVVTSAGDERALFAEDVSLRR